MPRTVTQRTVDAVNHEVDRRYYVARAIYEKNRELQAGVPMKWHKLPPETQAFYHRLAMAAIKAADRHA